MSHICYTPIGVTAVNTVGTQSTFGLSNGITATAAEGLAGSWCSNDYLQIPGGDDAASPFVTTTGGNQKYCGRALTTAVIATNGVAHETICTQSKPFVLHLYTDERETSELSGIVMMCNLSENECTPSGSLGFGLVYSQKT